MPLPIAGYGQQLVPGAAGGNNNALGLKLLLALLNVPVIWACVLFG